MKPGRPKPRVLDPEKKDSGPFFATYLPVFLDYLTVEKGLAKNSVGEPVLARVGVHRREHGAPDSERVPQDLRDRGHAVDGGRGVGDDAVRAREPVVIDAHHGDGVRRIRRLRRGERDDTPRSRQKVLRKLLVRPGPRSRFEERVHAELAPRRLAALRFRHERDLPAGDIDVALADRDLVGKTAEDRVEPQQVFERGGVGDLADGGDPDIVPGGEDPEKIAADAAEPPDANRQRHAREVISCQLSVVSFQRTRVP